MTFPRRMFDRQSRVYPRGTVVPLSLYSAVRSPILEDGMMLSIDHQHECSLSMNRESLDSEMTV